MAEKGPVAITITSSTILMTIALCLLVWLVFYLRDLVLIVLTAIVLASAVEPGVSWFMRYGFPRLLSVASVYVFALGLLFGIAYLFVQLDRAQPDRLQSGRGRGGVFMLAAMREAVVAGAKGAATLAAGRFGELRHHATAISAETTQRFDQ